MKKILILANNDEGLYKFRKELIEELIARHYDVSISLPYGEFIEPLKDMGCEFIDTPVDRRGINPFRDIKLLFSYLKLIKSKNPQCVFTYTIKPNVYGGIACKITGVPYFTNITGLGSSINNNGLLSKIALTLYKVGIKKSNMIFFQNKFNMDFFCKAGIVSGNSKLIPGSGVNLKEHSFEEYPENDGTLRLLFIGRIMKDKGVDEFIECAKKIKENYDNVYFDVIGAYDEERYKAVLDDLDNRGIINYLGHQKEIHSFLKTHHALILPSYHEGLSNVLLEAASTGRPIISTTVSGCIETFDNGISGIGFEPKNSQALIDAVETFINITYEEKRKMGLNGRKKAEKQFDRNLVIDYYFRELEKIFNV